MCLNLYLWRTYIKFNKNKVTNKEEISKNVNVKKNKVVIQSLTTQLKPITFCINITNKEFVKLKYP